MQVSFNDFVRLFEMEREGVSKKQNSSLVDQGGYHNETPNPYEGNRPANTSSPNNDSSFNALDTGGVVLRQNPRRMTLPARLQRYGRDLPFLSPIQSEMSPLAMRPPSNDLTGTP